MKKSAFSYLELIISMGLVVMVVFLTTPFLTHMDKTASSRYGEYKAYAKYLETPDPSDPDGHTEWVLYENTRRGKGEYDDSSEHQCQWVKGLLKDDPEKSIQRCVFTLPNHISNYTVHVYGGGGSGSQAYYDADTSTSRIFMAMGGAGGKAGTSVTRVDNLSKAVSNIDDKELYIYKCKDVSLLDDYNNPIDFINNELVLEDKDIPKNCIGHGGDLVDTPNTDENNKKIYIDQKISNIKLRTILKNIDTKLVNDILKYADNSNDAVYKINKYISDPTNNNYNKAKESVLDLKSKGPDSFYIITPLLALGNTGKNSFFKFETSQYNNQKVSTPALGGSGGIISSVKEKDIREAQEFKKTPDFYKINDNKYVISGSDGEASDVGAGGKGGNCWNNSTDGGTFDVNKCVGNPPLVGEKSEQLNQNVFHFGAGGGGSALYLLREEAVPPTDEEDEPEVKQFEGIFKNSGRGAGGAIVIQWTN